MNLKWIASLILGLIFQLAQALPIAFPTFACDAEAAAAACSCCESPTSCHCTADSSPSEKPPAPVVPSAPSQPSLSASLPETAAPVPALRESGLGSTTSSLGSPIVGFHGVTLRVAFCSFVI